MRFYVFTNQSKFVGATKHAEDAAILLTGQGKGSFIVQGLGTNNLLAYVSGEDGNPAESYDEVARICFIRQAGAPAQVLDTNRVNLLLKEMSK